MAFRESIVEFASLSSGVLHFRLAPGSVRYPGMQSYSPLGVDPGTLPPLDSPTNVAAYGARLKQALCSHVAVGPDLQQIFLTAAPNEASLQLLIGAPEGEIYRWETLYEDPDHFLALNGPCSVKRIVFAAGSTDTGVRTFVGPLRMAAFLSPNGVSAAREFDALSTAIITARAKGLAIEATFYLGEQELIDRKAADVAAGRLPGIQVKPVPSNAIAIEKVLKSDPVQFLHFFCHGHVKANVQLLEMASITDHDIDAPAGSIYLSIERLQQVLATVASVWVTVLNSCSGAEQVPNLHSMAASLATYASPVAIGMAEPILDSDATLFTQGFYDRAFQIVDAAVSGLASGSTSEVDFGPAVGNARALMHAAYEAGPPDAFVRWSFPIMYQRSMPLKVAPIADPGMPDRIKCVAQALQGLPGNAPPALRNQILALLDLPPAVPVALRPDRFGNVA